MQEIYVGIDLGTTAVKAGAVDAGGKVLAVASREFHLDTPKPGFVEFDAERYVERVFECVREVVGDNAENVKAIGLSSQGQTFVLLDKAGHPVRPAISWIDVRAVQEAVDLAAEAQIIGHSSIHAIMSGPKMLWLHRNEPNLNYTRFLMLPDYVIYRLTGNAVSDPVTSETSGLFKVKTDQWVPELLHYCGLSEEMMPKVIYAGVSAGKITPEAAQMLGLPPDVVVAVGTNDQTVGAVGAGNVTPGCASVTLGTALALVVSSEPVEIAPAGVVVAYHAVRGLYTLMAYAKTAGIVLRWFRDNFAPDLSYEELFKEVEGAPIGSDGLSCIPHFSGTASPTFNPSVRGAFSGLTLAHTRVHMARALVESLTFTLKENLELITSCSGKVNEIRAIGGGARSDVWLQMIADATGVTVIRPETSEAACLGAAELAMVAFGKYPTIQEASQALYHPQKRFEPNLSLRFHYEEAYDKYNKLYRSLYG
jgi:xylulokinase